MTRRRTGDEPETTSRRATVRLHVLVARRARQAVVFRRGPSMVTLLSKWDLANDRLEHGQWLKGRVYEHLCDFSPSGEHVVIFAGKHKGPVPTLTAVSRPPWFSALVTFPNHAGTWFGGGLFDGEYSLRIDHSQELVPIEGSPYPRRFQVLRLHPRADLRHMRLMRDGWVLGKGGPPSALVGARRRSRS